MASTVTITAIKKSTSDDFPSIQKSLQQAGHTRMPGTSVRLYPWRDVDGTYRTGLDENALYIRQMNPEDAQQEIERVRGFKEKAENMYPGIDLSPRSDFWTKMNDNDRGTISRAPIAILRGGDNILNIDSMEQFIVFCYLRVHKDVAPSAEALSTGRYPTALFYINDHDHEDEVIYKRKTAINKARKGLDTLSVEKRKMIARQLLLPVSSTTKETTVYRLLDDFIEKASTPKFAVNLEQFNKFLEMNDDNLLIRNTVRDAIEYRVIRRDSNNKFLINKKEFLNEDELIAHLTNIKNQEDYINVDQQIKIKKSVIL